MANPYSALVRMIELKLKRQEQSVSESKLQLEAAILAQREWEDSDRNAKQVPPAKR